MPRRTTKSELAMIIGIVATVAIGLSVAFAFSPVASPSKQPIKHDDCTLPAGDIKNWVVDIDGIGTNETRRVAASMLMNEYCGRPELVTEISTMSYPGVGLISYGCDSASGKIGHPTLQDAVREYAPIYCEAATLAVLERAEWMGLAVHDFKQEMAAYLEEQKQIFDHAAAISDEGPDPEYPWVETDKIQKAEATLVEIRGMIDDAKSMVQDGQYYDAAKSLDNANRFLIQLSSDLYS